MILGSRRIGEHSRVGSEIMDSMDMGGGDMAWLKVEKDGRLRWE